MNRFKDKRVVFALVALAVLGGGLALLVWLTDEPMPEASSSDGAGQLVIQTGRDDDIKLDPQKPLRCFVAGKLVGALRLEDCAKRNGVATGAMEVGLDTTGALAAAHGPGESLQPLAPGKDAGPPEPDFVPPPPIDPNAPPQKDEPDPASPATPDR